MYRIVTDKGELIITSDDPDVSVVIKQGGQQVDIVDLKTKKQVSLKSGEYEIELAGDGQDLRLNTDKFTLTRGGQQIVSVVRVPPVEPVARTEDKTAKVGAIRTFTGHTNVVSSVAFSADGKRAVTGSWDKTVRLWDVDAGTELKRFDGPAKTVRSVALSRNGARIAAGGGDQLVWLWAVAAGGEPRHLPGHGDTITGVAFSPDGKRLVSASLDQTARLWSAANGKGLGAPLGGLGPVESVAFSPDGRYVLCGGQDQLVHLWDVDTDKSVSWRGHSGVVNSVAFSPDGARAASGGIDGTVRIWEAPEARRCTACKTPARSSASPSRRTASARPGRLSRSHAPPVGPRFASANNRCSADTSGVSGAWPSLPTDASLFPAAIEMFGCGDCRHPHDLKQPSPLDAAI